MAKAIRMPQMYSLEGLGPWKVAPRSFRAYAPLAEKPESSNEGSSDGEVEIRTNGGI